ncbi:MAG: hypothetical protein QG608_2662 [Actinomycetota bacterium]|nr:hypothetical protein [Actinomycetota bacterium]
MVAAAERCELITEDEARRLRPDRPRRGEFLEVVGTVPEEDLPAGQTSGIWRRSVITAWRTGTITAARAVELVHGAITENDLPDRHLPEAQ